MSYCMSKHIFRYKNHLPWECYSSLVVVTHIFFRNFCLFLETNSSLALTEHSQQLLETENKTCLKTKLKVKSGFDFWCPSWSLNASQSQLSLLSLFEKKKKKDWIAKETTFCLPQATYAYMKAAYLSMLTKDDCLTFGETALTLFRY